MTLYLYSTRRPRSYKEVGSDFGLSMHMGALHASHSLWTHPYYNYKTIIVNPVSNRFQHKLESKRVFKLVHAMNNLVLQYGVVHLQGL